MKAIICAAGRGVRLGANSPKILLEFGGRTLLEWHVLRLREAGVHDVVLVTGYLREQIVSVVPGISARHGLSIRERVNERFHEGSVLSLAATLPEIEGNREPILLMDADVLYPAQMLERLIRSTHPTALLLDREYSTRDDDPVLVPVKDGRPFEFRKKWTGTADFVGESIGFFKIGPGDLPMLIDETRARSAGPEVRDSYDDVLRAMVLADRFGCEEVTGLPWTEIDFPDDLALARDEVLPRIERWKDAAP
ncbi:MAG TPA: phosphocholine cytidylyltransferase family protein [Chthoniobacterales bacterium]|nr:phosphocholine cytidylyltransferase family protein [Chthoniobacterales bacterium]